MRLKKKKNAERIQAGEDTIKIWEIAKKNGDAVYMENPVGALNNDERLPAPQIIQPWWFGDPVPKRTSLWLFNLPYLIVTCYIEPEYIEYNSLKTKTGKSRYSKFGKLSTRNGNEKNRELRSNSFPGIAKAMAEQWGTLCLPGSIDSPEV